MKSCVAVAASLIIVCMPRIWKKAAWTGQQLYKKKGSERIAYYIQFTTVNQTTGSFLKIENICEHQVPDR